MIDKPAVLFYNGCNRTSICTIFHLLGLTVGRLLNTKERSMTAARAPPPASGLPALPLTCGLFSTNLCSFRRDTLTMNTIKPGLLGAALLALAGLCNQPARADGTYTATANGVTPQSGSYPINHGYYGSSTTPASIPISVTEMSVQVTGAVPSSYISVNWGLYIQLIVHTPSGSSAGTYLVQDASPGLVSVPTKPDGSWQHLINNTGFYMNTYKTTFAGSWAIYAGSAITDSLGNNTVSAVGGNFTTVDVYMI